MTSNTLLTDRLLLELFAGKGYVRGAAITYAKWIHDVRATVRVQDMPRPFASGPPWQMQAQHARGSRRLSLADHDWRSCLWVHAGVALLNRAVHAQSSCELRRSLKIGAHAERTGQVARV